MWTRLPRRLLSFWCIAGPLLLLAATLDAYFPSQDSFLLTFFAAFFDVMGIFLLLGLFYHIFDIESLRKESERAFALLTSKRQKMIEANDSFLCHFAVHFMIVMIAGLIIGLPEPAYPVLFLLISMMLYEEDKIVTPLCSALGGYISYGAAKELQYMFPDGLDVDRVQFLLHDSLKDGAGIKTIRKLLQIFPDSLDVKSGKDVLPIHLACQFASVKIVRYFVRMDEDMLDARDGRNNTVLHHACQGGNRKVVEYLLRKKMALVAERNVDGDLPFYLLCDNSGKESVCTESRRYLDSIWRLLQAYPDAVSVS